MENEELSALRSGIEECRDRAGRARVKGRLRQEVLGYFERRLSEGMATDAIAAELGVGASSLVRWSGRQPTKRKRRMAKVVVGAPRPKTTVLSMTLRSGIRFDGLTVQDAAQLARLLS